MGRRDLRIRWERDQRTWVSGLVDVGAFQSPVLGQREPADSRRSGLSVSDSKISSAATVPRGLVAPVWKSFSGLRGWMLQAIEDADRGVELDVAVTARTLNSWQLLLQRDLGCSATDALALADAWRLHWSIGGRKLVVAIEDYRDCGFTDAEAAGWIANGFDFAITPLVYREAGVTDPFEAAHLHKVGWTDEFSVTEGFIGYTFDGIPLRLVLLILWAGCDTLEGLEVWLASWHAEESVEPGLRLLAALGNAPRPVPAPDAPLEFQRLGPSRG